MKQDFSPDATDWNQSGIDESEVDNLFQVIADKPADIPERERSFLSKNEREYLLAYLNRGGKRYLLEPLAKLQPTSYEVLEQFSSDLMIGFRWYSLVPTPWAEKNELDVRQFFLIKGRLVDLKLGWFPEESKIVESLPEVLAKSWTYRGSGWGIMPVPRGAVENRQLIGHPQNSWPSIKDVLHSFDPQWSQAGLLEQIQDKVSDVFVIHYNPHDGSPSEWCSMRCFLDTRPYGLDGKCGDQFFVIDSHTDKVVYHIHNGDTRNIRVLEPDGVGEAMDLYCAHTLMRTPGRFDFLPWSRVL